jgi:hypothetical protein
MKLVLQTDQTFYPYLYPYLGLKDPDADPGDPKTYGSSGFRFGCGSGSAPLSFTHVV